MKKFFLLFFMFLFSLVMKAQILDMVNFNVKPGNSLHYDHVFRDFSNIQYNLPFADYFKIEGNRLTFTVSSESFLWYFARNVTVTSNYNDQYVDLIFCQIDTGTICNDSWISYSRDPNTGELTPENSSIGGSGSHGYKEGVVRIYYYK